MSFAIAFPNIDPVAIALGPIVIRWYALAYVVGLVVGWRYVRALGRRHPVAIDQTAIDDLLLWATLAIILGGRLGYVLFYQPRMFVADPLAVLQVWRGGMSFHGGLIGVALALVLFARRRAIPALVLTDLVTAAAPIGLFLGRIANFVNGELFGRTTDVPWGVVFPHGGPIPRHPSQLYEAALEGLVLFAVLALLIRTPWVRSRPGIVSGAFLVGYGLARTAMEAFRAPDAHIGFLAFGTTLGQWLSVPMIALGALLIVWAARRPPVGSGT